MSNSTVRFSMPRRKALSALALTSVGILARPQRVRAQGAEKIQVATGVYESATPLYYAIKTGVFQHYGLEVELVATNGGAAAMAAVVSGTYQMARPNVLPVLNAHLRGIPITIVAPSDIYSPTDREALLQVAMDSPIKSGADLNGKTVGVVSLSDIDTLAAKAWVDKNGGDSSTLKFVELTSAASVPALVQRRIDAAVVEPPALDVSLTAGTSKTIGDPMGAIASNYMIAGYVGRADWASEHAEAVRRFAQAIEAANGYVNTHLAETAQLVAELTKIAPEVAAKMHRTQSATTFGAALLQPLIDAAAKYGIIARAFPAREIVWSG